MKRKIVQKVQGQKAVDGAGVHLVRVLGRDNVVDFDPFLMLDSFDSYNPEDYNKGFPMHPHRGIETVTYLIEGQMAHSDSLGNKGTIGAGECQWMTAGSGILHEEMPVASGRMLGLQLWVNLPQKYKMTEPAYMDISASMIQIIEEENATVRVVSGQYKEAQALVKPRYIDVSLIDIDIKPNSTFEMDTKPEETVFVFTIEGGCQINDEKIPTKTAVLFEKGDSIEIKTSTQGVRIIFYSGKALEEPVAWSGPVVMNTREELRKTFEELQQGTFIKHKI